MYCASNTKVGSESDDLVITFIRALRAIEWLSTIPIVYICESNTGQEASRHAERIAHEYRVIAVKENPKRFGVWTSTEQKSLYGSYARAVLDNEALFWLERFACISPDRDKRREELRIMLLEQISRSHVKQTTSVNDMTTIRVGWGGKVNGQNDDLVMALAIAQFFVYNIAARSIDYIDYSRIYGTI